ncbi:MULTISPECIES: class I SAM-dependent methyltransferase [Aerosakkonema]|uniref:class I SAM-dependent methyltransferase n=1 Tax=Aerosakkonema TaxID=1246629 RepID=UPI0035B8CF5A
MNTNERKWLIPPYPSASESLKDEKGIWNIVHQNYSKHIYSLTEDPQICENLINPSNQSPDFKIPNSPDIQIVIPGCGSEIRLQKSLLTLCPQIGQVYCTDFSETAIELAQNNWQETNGDTRLKNQQLIFQVADSTKLTEEYPDWKEKFDYVLVVNSVLSAEDDKNRQMIGEFYKVLKPGGRLYGFFPTIFCDLEIAYLIQSKAHWLTDGQLDLARSARSDGMWSQIYYTPLRLNRIFKEVGFKRLSFEVVFDDSDIATANLKEILEVDDPDIYNWEFLVRLEK